MRKLPIILTLSALSLFTLQARTNEPDVQPAKVVNTVSDVYKSIDFTGADKLNYEVFAKAYTGYQNLKAADKLNAGKNILTVCDYSLSANSKRMWIIDMDRNKVLLNTWVAHGQGTGEEYAKHFSNREGSHQSSMAFM